MAKSISLSFTRDTIYFTDDEGITSTHSLLNDGSDIGLNEGELQITTASSGGTSTASSTTDILNDPLQVGYQPDDTVFHIIGEVDEDQLRYTLNTGGINVRFSEGKLIVTQP